MELKVAILQEEKDSIKSFLLNNGLELDECDYSMYLEENGSIIGTISSFNFIIKCLCVDEKYREDNLATLLINGMIESLRDRDILSYAVFTKPMYKEVFKSVGFKLLVETDEVSLLEGGLASIDDEINALKIRFINTFGDLNDELDISSVVINADPIHEGHMHLIEEASKNSDYVIVFLVEENLSYFDFKTRFSFVYLACKKFSNVIVVPSSKYIISSITFPSYFLKKEDKVERNQYLIDALLFRNYFMKKLSIKRRYIGKEYSEKMRNYNLVLKDILGDKVVEIDRLKIDNEIVSASTIRKLLKEGKIEEACKFLPKEITQFVRMHNEKC